MLLFVPFQLIIVQDTEGVTNWSYITRKSRIFWRRWHRLRWSRLKHYAGNFGYISPWLSALEIELNFFTTCFHLFFLASFNQTNSKPAYWISTLLPIHSEVLNLNWLSWLKITIVSVEVAGRDRFQMFFWVRNLCTGWNNFFFEFKS